jgi:hypothetical protein
VEETDVQAYKYNTAFEILLKNVNRVLKKEQLRG